MGASETCCNHHGPARQGRQHQQPVQHGSSPEATGLHEAGFTGAASSHEQQPSALQPAGEQIDPLLALLPLVKPSGTEPTRHPRAFIKAVNDNNLVVDFDWKGWQPVTEQFVHSAVLSTAAVADLMRLLTLHVRQDACCPGHLAAGIRSGHIHQLLRRLE